MTQRILTTLHSCYTENPVHREDNDGMSVRSSVRTVSTSSWALGREMSKGVICRSKSRVWRHPQEIVEKYFWEQLAKPFHHMNLSLTPESHWRSDPTGLSRGRQPTKRRPVVREVGQYYLYLPSFWPPIFWSAPSLASWHCPHHRSPGSRPSTEWVGGMEIAPHSLLGSYTTWSNTFEVCLLFI